MPIVVYSSDPRTYSRVWLPFAVWGLGLIAFGAIIIVWPVLTRRVFVIAFGALCVFAGLTQLGSAIVARRRLEGLAWFPVVVGSFALAIGIVTLTVPDVVAQLFALVIGLAALAWGISDVAIGWTGRGYFRTWGVHVFRGLLTAAAGVLLIVRPLDALVAIAWLVGAWAILIGLITLWLALVARSGRSQRIEVAQEG